MRILIPLLLAACGTKTSPVSEASAETPARADGAVASWKGGEIRMSDLEAKLGNRLLNMENEYKLQRYEAMSRVLDSAIDDALLEEAVAERKLDDVDALLRAEVEEKVTLPNDAEVAAFFEQVRDQLRGAELEQVRPMLMQELMQRRLADRYGAFLKELRKDKGVEAKLPYPDLARIPFEPVDTDPVLGKADAPVTIVQFAEYQCYFCNKVNPTLEALLSDYDGKVKLVFKDFPLDNHPRAKPAAVAARCAGDQGKYWEMNRLLLGNQQSLSDTDFERYANELALDGGAFSSCLTSGKHDDAIRAAYQSGEDAGVQATPTFFVNGLLVSGAQPYDVFKTVIDQELAAR